MTVVEWEPWTTVVGDCEQDPSNWVNTAGVEWVKISFSVSAKGDPGACLAVETSDDPGFGWKECQLVTAQGLTTVVLSKKGIGGSIVPLQQWVRWRNKVVNSAPACGDGSR
jgi:hypothetical protein